MVGVMAGLIPCPLTLFVMSFAIACGVPEAGIAFALLMMLGVALTLSIVAVAAILFRDRMVHLMAYRATLLDRSGRLIEASAGLVLSTVAEWKLWPR